MVEDLTFGTCLDKVDAYIVLAKAMEHIGASGRGAVIEERLTGEQLKLIQTCISKGRASFHNK
jgi:hypothetical protein